jgi:ABC-type phosphate transport system permease subunit
MKTLIVCFAIWMFAVPAAVAMFLIVTFLAARIPALYITSTFLALASSIFAMVWGLFWLEPFLRPSFWLFPKTHQHTNSIQEKKHEKSLECEVRS